ncbi:glycoside hydrolase family 17 protein [Daldinia vernicosa]|uniref:glycoside hydrolase family 17 protein n=1 Tax=Daldinia vernicosa TaxID=114800 RepID=UPI002008434C|nr:glycoside hydrolase family 17 protein [Daldinia vernicosa]KAI0850245.1 glycoside hydrolase family 17 protein [Daldinia vernicosa]
MRSTLLSLSLLSLLGLSAGQPRHQHQHLHRHRANRAPIAKRDKVTVTDSKYSTTTEVPEVVVYVDQNNNPIRTTTETVVYVPATVEIYEASTPTTEISPLSTKAAPVVESESSSYQTASPTTQQASSSQLVSSADSYPTSSKSASSSAASPSSSSGALHGVSYSPYKGNGECKTADEVDADFALIANDYGVMRLYGVDCDQVATAYAAAKKYGNKLFLGIYDITAVEDAVSTIAAGVQNDWDIVDTVSVGNELVNDGAATVDQSISAMNQTRSLLRSAGYEGPVVVVDTAVAILAHPELCDESDYCAINCHPFFDANTGPDAAGSFVTSTVSSIRSKLSDSSKRIVVTETGWPWQGESNGEAVPGLDQQSTALSSIKTAFASNASNVILFTAFNDMWKKAEAATFMAEQYWGMGGQYSPSDE